MITLYHCSDARSFRPLWMLEELGIAYDLKVLPFPPRVLAKDYLAQNPLGTIPLLVDGNTHMTESAAICEYLATVYGPTPLAVTPDEPAFGAYLNWLHLGEATLTFPQAIVLRYSQYEPEHRLQPQVVTDYARWFLGRLRAVDSALSQNETLCAGRFTAADISVGYACLLAEIVGFAGQFSPAIQQYLRRIKARAPFQRALAAEQAGAAQLQAPGVRAHAIDMNAVLKS